MGEWESPLLVRAREDIASQLRSETRLSALPTIASEVMAVASLPDSDAAAVARVLGDDPVLVEKLLRVANSPTFAPVEPIRSLQQAVSRLGLALTGEIVFLLTVRGTVYDVPGHQEYAWQLWRHAVATAAFSREIAGLRRQATGTEFVAGLLHDAGAPLVLQMLARKPASFLVLRESVNLHMVVQEFHTDAGAMLCRSWNVPEAAVQAAQHHLTPHLATQATDVVATVALADQLSRLVHEDAPPLAAEDLMDGDDGIVRQLDLHVADFRALLRRHPFVAQVVAELS
jgi:HD-like signal output (HDOD) protein